jgi:CBS domain containing-hemolysin-like protein
MRTNMVALPAGATAEELRSVNLGAPRSRQYLFPVVDGERKLKGVLTRNELNKFVAGGSSAPVETVARKAVAAYGDEPLRSVVMRMAETGITRMPVLDDSGKLHGMVSLRDLLRARVRNLEEERRRERILRLRVPFVLPREAESSALTSPVRES